jgi:hypothetical protein
MEKGIEKIENFCHICWADLARGEGFQIIAQVVSTYGLLGHKNLICCSHCHSELSHDCMVSLETNELIRTKEVKYN